MKRNEVDIAVGRRIRSRRISLDMSELKFADALAVTVWTVRKYEGGTQRIGAAQLLRTSQILGTAPSFFFDHDTATLERSTGISGVAPIREQHRGRRARLKPLGWSMLFLESIVRLFGKRPLADDSRKSLR
jgi:transcriptional regulator with XRE-family HTH domain